MYSGEFRISLDEKMRMRIPAKLRKELGDALVVCAGPDTCALLMTEHEMDLLVAEKAAQIKLHEREKQDALRYFNSFVFSLKEDGQGRSVLPAKISKLIGAEKNSELVFLGVTNRIEIWSAEAYDRKFNVDQFDIRSVVFDLLDL